MKTYNPYEIATDSSIWATETITYYNKTVAMENRQEDKTPNDTMRGIHLKDIQNGTWFKLNPTDSAKVFTKDCYERSERKYACSNWETGEEKWIDGDKVVYVCFYF